MENHVRTHTQVFLAQCLSFAVLLFVPSFRSLPLSSSFFPSPTTSSEVRWTSKETPNPQAVIFLSMLESQQLQVKPEVTATSSSNIHTKGRFKITTSTKVLVMSLHVTSFTRFTMLVLQATSIWVRAGHETTVHVHACTIHVLYMYICCLVTR